MPREREQDRVKRWTERLTASTTAYTAWEQRFRCKTLYEYYEGYQWAGMGLSEEEAKQRYTINLVFPTIEIKLPSLLFYNPKTKVEPRPPHADDAGSTVTERAKLAGDTLQTFIDDKKVCFKLETLLALRDAEFRFGLVEVGYTGDWIDNPNAGKPVLRENSDEPMVGENGAPLTQPAKVPRQGSESLFLKRIPPQSFRVSSSSKNDLGKNDWVAYYEWFYVEDVKANPKYKNTSKLKAGGAMADATTISSDPDAEKYRGMVKVWKIWDLREKVRYVIADGHEKFLLDGEPYRYLPLAPLKYYERADDWYPLPPTFNWISPQDELNETRDGQKTHRRRFKRRYTAVRGTIDGPELEKLETGPDGVMAFSNARDPIQAVEDASLDPGNAIEAVAQSREDFREISGVGSDQRGDAQAETATQANIVETRSRIRESSGRMVVAEWLGCICTLMLRCLVEKMQLPFWVQVNNDPLAGDVQGVQQTAKTWQEISSSDIGDLNFDVTVDVASLSPVSEDQQRLAWNQVLALLSNPSMLMILMQSEVILRKTLKFYGITSDADVREIQRVGTLMLTMTLASQANAGGAKPKGSGQPTSVGQPPAGVPAAGPGMVQ